MATMNPTAVQKTVDALTNQEILTSIIKKSEQLAHDDITIELAGAILNNPDGSKLVDWLADGKDMAEEIASELASLITAVRMPLTKEKPAKEAAKKQRHRIAVRGGTEPGHLNGSRIGPARSESPAAPGPGSSPAS